MLITVSKAIQAGMAPFQRGAFFASLTADPAFPDCPPGRKKGAVERIVELCERALAFIWLTKGQKPKRDAFYDFKGKKLAAEVLDELNYQFLRRLKK